jgi:hypothetical protein
MNPETIMRFSSEPRGIHHSSYQGHKQGTLVNMGSAAPKPHSRRPFTPYKYNSFGRGRVPEGFNSAGRGKETPDERAARRQAFLNREQGKRADHSQEHRDLFQHHSNHGDKPLDREEFFAMLGDHVPLEDKVKRFTALTEGAHRIISIEEYMAAHEFSGSDGLVDRHEFGQIAQHMSEEDKDRLFAEAAGDHLVMSLEEFFAKFHVRKETNGKLRVLSSASLPEDHVHTFTVGFERQNFENQKLNKAERMVLRADREEEALRVAQRMHLVEKERAIHARPKFTTPCVKAEAKPHQFHIYPDASSHRVANVSLPKGPKGNMFHGVEPPPEGTKANYVNPRLGIHGSTGAQVAGTQLGMNFGHWGGKVKQLEVVDRMLTLQDDDHAAGQRTLFDDEYHVHNPAAPFGDR